MTKFSKETWATVLISVSSGFLLCGYEILRSSSNTLFQAAYGTQNLVTITALMPIGVILLLYIYSRLLSKLGPQQTLRITTLGSGIIVMLCYFAIRSASNPATGILYIFREAYIVLLVEQYWSFLNSTFGPNFARKLNGPIAGVSSIGGLLGGILLHKLAQPLGTTTMLLFGAASVIPAALFSEWAYRTCGEPKPTAQEKEGRQGHLGLKVLKHSPLLISLLLLVMTKEIVSNVLTLSFQTTLNSAIPNIDQQTAYSGQFYALLNATSAALQFVAAPFLMGFLPIGLIQMCIPLIHIGTIYFLITAPSLKTISIALLTFKAIDYSIFRATKETLYIPLSFDARYRAKEVIDVFGYRFSKGGSSAILTLLQQMGIAASSLYSWIALGGAALWFILVIPILTHLPFKKSQKP